MTAVVIDKIHSLECLSLPDPRPAEDEVLIRVLACGIGREEIRIYQATSEVLYPVIPGKEFAGEVVGVGACCQRISPGDRVAVDANIPCNNCPSCLAGRYHFCPYMQIPGFTQPGGMAELVCVKERAVFLIGNLSYEQAIFMNPLACALHGTSCLAPEAGHTALILGAGPMGILLGRALRSRGVAHIDYLEQSPDRMDKVAQECRQVFVEISDVPCEHYHYAIDATGNNTLSGKAVAKLLPTGKLLLFGLPEHGTRLDLPAFAVIRNEIQILGSFTSLKDSVSALSALEGRAILVDDLISHRIRLEQLSHYLEKIIWGESAFTVVVNPQTTAHDLAHDFAAPPA